MPMSPHDTASLVIATSRVVDAAPAQVFAAFSDPHRLERWWGPKGFTNTFSVFEFRPGGQWRFTMHGPDGGNYPNESVFVEVTPSRRIVIRHLNPPHFTMTVTLSEERGKTHVEWHMLFESAEECERVKKYAAGANEQNLDRLEAELARE
jgi:uncharacterized protein YndB with AHSA1/START domain